MSDMKALDLKGFVNNGMREVFSTMLSMDLEPSGRPSTDGSGREERIVGSVSFAGAVMGSVSITLSSGFGREITAAMLGMSPDEVEDQEEIDDAVAEMSNMIGGYLKSRFCDSGLPCELSIPSITSGTDFKIELMNWEQHEQFSFAHDGKQVEVAVFLKAGS
ncbi:putative Chemotaxis protein CheC [uncultured Desulfatiglans sp.]|nr:putative Chemotaxis protein CheC [uncultured Desulfatiglans sp.]